MAVDRLIQHLEIDLHRLARKVALETQHALGLIEPWRLRQLRRDDADIRQVDALGGEIGERLRQPCGGVGVAEAGRSHVAQHGEVAGLKRVVKGDQRRAQQQHDLLGVGHHHLRRRQRCGLIGRRLVLRQCARADAKQNDTK